LRDAILSDAADTRHVVFFIFDDAIASMLFIADAARYFLLPPFFFLPLAIFAIFAL